MDLRQVAGSPPQTTLRGHLQALTEMGVLERTRRNRFPGSVDFELRKPGSELVAVGDILGQWLAGSPQEPLQPGTSAAKGSIKALVDGWRSGIVRALAARPFSLTELSSIINGLSYPALERRLGAMKLSGQIERCPGNGRRTPYRPTKWLRQGVAPLAAAARWERKNLPDMTPAIAKIDVEAAFLMTVPMVELPNGSSGVCRLVVESSGGDGDSRLAGVTATIEGGRVASCLSRLDGSADVWAIGSAVAWLRAVAGQRLEQLEIGGEEALVNDLLDGLRAFLSEGPAAPLEPGLRS
jgi:DNA-binding HxlR family transcriptional regulator